MDFKYLLGNEWYEALEPLLSSDYFVKLGNAIATDRKTNIVYPEKNSDLLFKAFRTTPLSKVKVVILGQDPYHDGSYDGFAFSNSITKKGRVSPSLQNILREVQEDIYPQWKFETYIADNPECVSLERWAQQGVLLINTAHTVIKGVPDSHTALWKPFTVEVTQTLIQEKTNIVWILWGRRAQKIFWDSFVKVEYPKEYLSNNIIIESAHPSPFSAYQGFFGSRPFSEANKFLEENNVTPIIW